MWVGIQPSEGLSGTKTTVPGRKVVPGLPKHSAGSIHAGAGPLSNRPCVSIRGRGRQTGVSAEAGGLEPRPAQPSLSPGPPRPAGLAVPDKLLNLLCFHFFLCQVPTS